MSVVANLGTCWQSLLKYNGGYQTPRFCFEYDIAAIPLLREFHQTVRSFFFFYTGTTAALYFHRGLLRLSTYLSFSFHFSQNRSKLFSIYSTPHISNSNSTLRSVLLVLTRWRIIDPPTSFGDVLYVHHVAEPLITTSMDN